MFVYSCRVSAFFYLTLLPRICSRKHVWWGAPVYVRNWYSPASAKMFVYVARRIQVCLFPNFPFWRAFQSLFSIPRTVIILVSIKMKRPKAEVARVGSQTQLERPMKVKNSRCCWNGDSVLESTFSVIEADRWRSEYDVTEQENHGCTNDVRRLDPLVISSECLCFSLL